MFDEKRAREQVAEELGVDIELVKAVISNMWKDAQRGAKTDALQVDIPHLGTYKIRKKKIVDDLKRYRNFLFAPANTKTALVSKLEKMLAKPIPHSEWVDLPNNEEFQRRKILEDERVQKLYTLRQTRKERKGSDKGEASL